jgi:hypothetical protein
MVDGVPPWVHEDCCEGADPIKLIVEDLHQYWEDRFPYCSEIVIRGLSFEGGKASRTSWKRSVIALSVMTQTVFRGTKQGP